MNDYKCEDCGEELEVGILTGRLKCPNCGEMCSKREYFSNKDE